MGHQEDVDAGGDGKDPPGDDAGGKERPGDAGGVGAAVSWVR